MSPGHCGRAFKEGSYSTHIFGPCPLFIIVYLTLFKSWMQLFISIMQHAFYYEAQTDTKKVNITSTHMNASIFHEFGCNNIFKRGMLNQAENQEIIPAASSYDLLINI